MDPNAALASLIDYAVRGDGKRMFDMAEVLERWLDNGGYPPDDPRQPAPWDITSFYNPDDR